MNGINKATVILHHSHYHGIIALLTVAWPNVAEESVSLRQEVATGAAQIQQMQQDLQAWEDAVTVRDAELRNLQVHF